MPAILDDPAAPTIYRVSGEPPYPDPAHPSVPPTILPRHVTLRDRQTVATVIPFASRHEVPESLLRYLSDQFSKEIEGGDTYPMMEPMSLDKFASYWFQNFAGIMLLGHIESAAEVVEGKDWSKECLGTFYIKPNYPGRSSHICNAGFIVTDASRNRGVGRLMGETYLEYAPKLGYTYSVFNLVYETNVASCKIWDGLGFKRIGRVKGAGNLKSHPDRLVDAIIYGRDLGDSPGNEELVSEERFDKIKFYLKYGRYPNGADRAEKSRLRSAATHYKLLEGDVLMLKDKEVISDPQRQYEIARGVHNQAHAGINKTTATIAERYHWSRIKETVSDVIRNCSECKDLGKASSSSQPQSQCQSQLPSPGAVVAPVNGVKRPNMNATSGAPNSKRSSPSPSSGSIRDGSTQLQQQQQPRPPPVPVVPPISDASTAAHLAHFTVPSHHQFTDPTTISLISPSQTHHHPLQAGGTDTAMTGHEPIPINHDDTHHHHHHHHHSPMLQEALHSQPHHHSQSHSHHQVHPLHHHQHHHSPSPVILPVPADHPHSVSGVVPPDSVYQPIDPQIISQSLHHHHMHHYPFDPHPHHHHHVPHHDADFQALINAAGGEDVSVGVGVTVDAAVVRTREEEDEAERAAVDRDLEMLIEQPRDEDDEEDEQEPEPEPGKAEEEGSSSSAALPSSFSKPSGLEPGSGISAAIAAIGTGTGTGTAMDVDGGASSFHGVDAGAAEKPPEQHEVGADNKKMDVTHLLSSSGKEEEASNDDDGMSL